MEIKFFNKNIEDFVRHMEKSVIARVLRTIDLLEQFGQKLGMPHSKKIASNLFELRVRGKQEVRIFYTFHKNSIVLLHGFVKKTRKAPPKEINIAKRRLNSLE